MPGILFLRCDCFMCRSTCITIIYMCALVQFTHMAVNIHVHACEYTQENAHIRKYTLSFTIVFR